ncbi:MAG: efflux RND transporter periplasmic adaptor subunit [bacterium]|nr:efflux RND transporter periplasmic adaptor subunit [bacterium]
MERSKKIIIVAVIVLLLIVWKGFSGKKESPVDLVTAENGELVESISSSGKIDAGEKADLIFQSGGRVSWVGVKEGDRVKKWQGIASLDTVSLSVAYQQALNTYKDKQALAEKAEDDVKGHSGDETYAQKATRTTAQVARDNAYDSLRGAGQALKFATIVAPFEGIITKASPAYAGINVTLGGAVYSIVNPKTMYFEAEINEVDVIKIKEGQKVTLSIDAYPEEVFDTSVELIGLSYVTTSTGGTAYKVKISLPRKDEAVFRLGMKGDAEFILGTKENVLLIPSSSLFEDGDNNFVWFVQNGKLKKVQVEVGGSSIDRIEIKSGLNEGQSIVSSPKANFKEGQKIKSS